MTRKNKRTIARACRYMDNEIGLVNDILDDEEDRLDNWAENLKGSQKHEEAEGLVEDIRALFDDILDTLEEIRNLCGIDD